MDTDILESIKNFNSGREKGPLQLKFKAMAESPFRFFRGTCGLFYQGLVKQYPFPASPVVWACGDLHIENFGSYKGSSRLVYFDLNDFDEALLAPALWEICRLTASVQIAAAEIGFSEKETMQLVNTLLFYYRQILKKGKPVDIERETARGLIKKLVNKVAERKEADLVKKRTDEENPGKLQINGRLFALPGKEKKSLLTSFNKWLTDNAHGHLQALDAGFRIAGTGSIGVKRYLLLVENTHNRSKKILIDIKQALPSALTAYIDVPQPVWPGEAARIIGVQEMVQHVSPAFLSSFEYDDKWFVVKELQPMADKVNLSQAIKQPAQVENYIANLGMLSASGHLRSSGRKGSATADELNAFAEDGNWENKLKEWSAAYAVQLKQQYSIYKKAWTAGFFRD